MTDKQQIPPIKIHSDKSSFDVTDTNNDSADTTSTGDNQQIILLPANTKLKIYKSSSSENLLLV